MNKTYIFLSMMSIFISLPLLSEPQFVLLGENRVQVTDDRGQKKVIQGTMIDLTHNKVDITGSSGVYLKDYKVLVTSDHQAVRVYEQAFPEYSQSMVLHNLTYDKEFQKGWGYVGKYETEVSVVILTTKSGVQGYANFD